MKNLLLSLLFLVSLPSFASTPLVTVDWLSQHIEDDNLVLLDIRSKEYFDYVRIPTSVHSDYAQWRLPQTKVLQKMLPSKKQLEKLLSSAGIKTDSKIVIIAMGDSATSLAAASRVYWTLEQIGHKEKSILNGGLVEWAQHKLPLTQTKAPLVTPSSYKIQNIKPQINASGLLKNIDSLQIIDTRSVAEHKGLIASPDERKGTIKNSKSLPYDWFSENQSGKFTSLENIKNIAQSINYNNNKASIVYCHTGHRAALSWFVFNQLLGNKQTKLYDGSTRDWATQSTLPMTQEIYVK